MVWLTGIPMVVWLVSHSGLAGVHSGGMAVYGTMQVCPVPPPAMHRTGYIWPYHNGPWATIGNSGKWVYVGPKMSKKNRLKIHFLAFWTLLSAKCLAKCTDLVIFSDFEPF